MTVRLAVATLAIALSAAACAEGNLDVAMMQRVASDMNKGLPAMQDEETRFDEVVVGPGLAWTYKFTLVNVDSSPAVVAMLKQDYLPGLIKTFCTLPATQIFLEEGIATRMEHADRKGQVLSSIVLSREACAGGV